MMDEETESNGFPDSNSGCLHISERIMQLAQSRSSTLSMPNLTVVDMLR